MKKTTLAVLPLAALLVLTVQDLGATVHWLPASATADKVLVLKHRRRLYLIKGNHVLKTYRVSLGIRPVGPKLREGDHRTPEGAYMLDWHNTESEFYKSIHISYPNQKDLDSQKDWEYRPVGIYLFMASPMVSTVRAGNQAIGPMVALPSAMKRWRKYGARWQTVHPS